MDDHPRHPLLAVVRPRFWVPPMQGLGDAICVGVEFNRHGILCNGFGRIGKTEAMLMLAKTLKWRKNFRMFWHLLLASKPTQPSEAYFFNSLKLSANLKVREQTQSIFSVHHMTNFLCEEAARVGAEVIVLGIDDANRLRREDYDHLVTLDNQISLMGFRLFVLLMLQTDDDQTSVPSIATERHPSQITGRFTADEFAYTGLVGRAHVKEAFRSFGDQTFGGRTFLEEFAGHAVSQNWHIDQCADEFCTAVEIVRGQNDLPLDEPFPMQCFDTASYYLTVRIAGANPHFEGFSLENYMTAIEASGLVALEKARLPKDRN